MLPASPAGGLADWREAARRTWVSGNFHDNLTGTAQDATLDVMDHQGAGWTRPAADTRRQASWPWPQDGADGGDPEGSAETGPQAVLRSPGGPSRASRRGTGAQPVMGYRSGAQPVMGYGSGAQPVMGYGSGGQPVLGGLGSPGQADRTPVRGFPLGFEPSETPPDGFSSWSAPQVQAADDDREHVPDAGYGSYGVGQNPLDHTDPTITRVDPQPAQTVTGPAGRRRGAKAKPKRRLPSRRALAAAAVVVVAAAGFGGGQVFYEPRVNAPLSPSLRLPTSAPGSPDFNQSLGKWQHIGARTQDPDPLTVDGLFPPQFVLNGSSYLRTAASVTKNCSQAVYGAQLQAALQSGGCTQVARASYLSGNGQMMGTVGVVNLTSTAAASKAGQLTGPQAIIAPLSAKKVPTRKLGNGTGVVQAEVKGHYLILMWAEFANLKSPSNSAAKQELEQFAASLVTGSANINLSTRMLSGRA